MNVQIQAIYPTGYSWVIREVELNLRERQALNRIRRHSPLALEGTAVSPRVAEKQARGVLNKIRAMAERLKDDRTVEL